MDLQARLISTTCMIVAGLGLTHAIAAEPVPPKTAQQIDVCRQVGSEYVKLYTIEEQGHAITICQKGDKYYYVTSAK